MNTTQFTAYLVRFAIFSADVADNKLRGRDAKAELLRHAATMTDEAKIAADTHVVGALEARFGIKAQPQQKQRRYSGMGFKHGSAAHQALARARRLLAPKDHAEAETMIAALMTTHANSADPVAAMLKRFDSLTGGQKRSFLAQLTKARG